MIALIAFEWFNVFMYRNNMLLEIRFVRKRMIAFVCQSSITMFTFCMFCHVGFLAKFLVTNLTLVWFAIEIFGALVLFFGRSKKVSNAHSVLVGGFLLLVFVAT